MKWTQTTGVGAVRFAATREIDHSEEGSGSSTVFFTDGTALRLSAEDGPCYSTLTGCDPAEVVVEIGQ